MNIRRIIREEMDDLQWIKDIDPNEELYEPWVIRAIELMEDTPYYFDENIKRQLGLLKRHTRSKNIIEDAIMVIFKRILLRRIGEYASFPGSYEDFKKEDKKFLEGYELLKKSIQPKIYNRMLKNLKEQDELEWIKDVQSNQDIAQEIADKSEIKDNKLSLPFSPFPSPFLLLSLSSYPFFSFKKYCKEQYGLIEEDLQDVWDRYKDIITDKINNHSNLNENDDMDWIRDVEPISYDFLVGKALYFDPPINDYEHLLPIVETLESMGFTTHWVDDFYEAYSDQIIGMYLREHDDQIIFTTNLNEHEEEYQEHIDEYAELSRPVEVLDGWRILGPHLGTV